MIMRIMGKLWITEGIGQSLGQWVFYFMKYHACMHAKITAKMKHFILPEHV